MTRGLHLVHPGDPLPKERPRVVRGRAFTPERTRTAEAALAWAARASCAIPLAGPVELRAEFRTRTRVRGDLDNLVKLASDALNGIWWRDDRQIVRIEATVVEGVAVPATELWADEVVS